MAGGKTDILVVMLGSSTCTLQSVVADTANWVAMLASS